MSNLGRLLVLKKLGKRLKAKKNAEKERCHEENSQSQSVIKNRNDQEEE